MTKLVNIMILLKMIFFHRSITGEGVRKTLKIIKKEFPN